MTWPVRTCLGARAQSSYPVPFPRDRMRGRCSQPISSCRDATASSKRTAALGTTPVGSFGVANAFGLSDMHGNVKEWRLGEYHSSYDGAPSDGRPWIANGDLDRHVLRGGSWDDLAVDCRSANRYSYPREGRQRTIGFRLAMSLAVPKGLMRMADPPPVPRDLVGDGRGPRGPERPAAARVLRRRLPGRE